ncbi:hypothetical protein AN958_11366 [Leucoagaricus sp. SymC.cos]|nr:hypothetical protein AN958_11366 [Leucoagaricus sp. SymC.cos]
MKMLGNSTCGLLPHQKRLLYCSCVISLTTYGCCLWYFASALIINKLKLLQQMQQNAALWITGAFRTSPSGGVESLAGLIPIHLHLKKLTKCACLQYITLPKSHPIHTLLSAHNAKGALPHPRSLDLLSERNRATIQGPLVDADDILLNIEEKFSPLHNTNYPSLHLLDNFSDRFSFFDFNRSSLKELRNHSRKLNARTFFTHSSPDTAIIVTDGSVPNDSHLQASACYQIWHNGALLHSTTIPCGRCTSSEAELTAQHFGLWKALASLPNDITNYIILTDHLPSSYCLLDPSIHKGQYHTIATTNALCPWLECSSLHKIKFWYIPSKFTLCDCNSAPNKPGRSCCLLCKVHLTVKLNHRHARLRPSVSMSYLHKRTTNSCLKQWQHTFRINTQYRGHSFLMLRSKHFQGDIILPQYHNGGSWLRELRTLYSLDTSDLPVTNFNVVICAICAITNHAPIGTYQSRFFPKESTRCRCGFWMESCKHIILNCPLYV